MRYPPTSSCAQDTGTPCQGHCVPHYGEHGVTALAWDRQSTLLLCEHASRRQTRASNAGNGKRPPAHMRYMRRILAALLRSYHYDQANPMERPQDRDNHRPE